MAIKNITPPSQTPDFLNSLTGYYEKLYGQAKWDVPVRIERGHIGPLDASTLFRSKSDAEAYASGSTVTYTLDGKTYTQANAYPGQFIAVVDETTGATTGYIIGSDGKLIELGSVESTLNGMNVVVGDQKIPLTIVDNKLELSVGGGLKMEGGVLTVAEINTISDISANATSNDPAATSAIVEYTKNYVAEKATVTVEKLATADTGYASTYIIKQGGTQVGEKINIPKDFLVKSAELTECSEDGKPDASLKKGDKYIDFVVNTADNSETPQHVYLKVEDLVDVYTSLSSDTIDLSVVGTQISAYVRDGSIAKKHLAEDVVAWGSELSSNAVTDANAYTDAQIAAHNTAAKELLAQVSADAVTSALTDANAYTDAQITEKIRDIDFSIYAISSEVSAELCDVSAETLISAAADAEAKVASEATARTEAIQALSDALSADVKTLAEDYEATKADYLAVKDDYATVSADHKGRIETLENHITSYANISGDFALSDDVKDDIATAKTEAINAANTYTDEAIANIGTPLRFVGVTEDEKLSANSTISALSGIEYVGGAIKDGDVALNTKNGTEYVWNNGKWHEIGDENNHATKAELEAEKTAREAADAYLSGAIDNKIYCGDYGAVVSADSLSVVKISQDEYHKLVNGENGGIDDKAVYIVNNDGAYNMYDERIINVGAPISANDAATKEYVDAAKEAAIAAIPLSVSQLVWDITTISCGDSKSF